MNSNSNSNSNSHYSSSSSSSSSRHLLDGGAKCWDGDHAGLASITGPEKGNRKRGSNHDIAKRNTFRSLVSELKVTFCAFPFCGSPFTVPVFRASESIPLFCGSERHPGTSARWSSAS